MDNPNLPAPSAPNMALDRLRGAFGQIGLFADQPALRRALPAIGLVLAAGLGLAAYLWLAPADRMVVQSNLAEADKGRALEVLRAQGLGAEIDPASGALTVAAADYHRARMALASEGLPQAAPDGLAALTDMPMGASRSVETARLRRMLETDLAQTIAALDPVRAARVHLALPERSAFLNDQSAPSASVVVQLDQGAALSAAQTAAIISLVAASVPEMPRDAVSVVDHTGALLSGGAQDAAMAEADAILRQRMATEQLYRDRILALITPILGMGNAAVEVTVEMDFTRSEVTSETFDPEATALRSEQQSLTQSTDARAAGIPGAITNTPPPTPELGAATPAPTQGGGETGDLSQSHTRNFEVSRRVETTLPQTGRILRIHAAVLARAPVTAEGTIDTAQDSAMIAQIEALTRAAIGFEDARGDVVTISTSPFVTADLMPEPMWYEAAWLPEIGRMLAQVVVLAIIFLGVVRPLLGRLLTQGAAGAGAFGDGAVEVGAGESLGQLRRRLEAAPRAEDLNGAISYEQKLALLQEMGRGDTARVAQAFRAMLDTNDGARP